MAANDTESGLTGEDKLIAVLRREEQDASNWQQAQLTVQRETAFNYYDRNPIGDEVEGQSQIVTSEFLDTVETLMPSLMRVFASSDNVVEFTPRRPGDEPWAKEATEYVPHVFMRENEGFTKLYWFIKDAIMYRLSVGCVDTEEKEEVKSQPVEPVSVQEWPVAQHILTEKAAQEKVEIAFAVKLDEATQTMSGEITTTRKVKRVVTDVIPPEDFLMTPNARTLAEASYRGYRKRVTASDLRLLDIEQDIIDELSSDRLYTVEQTQRQPDVATYTSDRSRTDSERQFWLVVAYVKFDENDDGISETLRVVYAHAGGTAATIIEKSEWEDGEAPIVTGSPILMSHTVPGRSVFDLVKDIQDIGTAVARGMLNNMYMVNTPRPMVSDRVDLASLIDWTPAMPIRMLAGSKPTPEEINWLQVPPTMDKALAVLQWKDDIKDRRTGVNPSVQGLDADNVNKTLGGQVMNTSAGEARTELIARVFAECAIKPWYRLVYRAIKRAASGRIDYWNGKAFANCDPTQWPDDMELVANVGMGAGNKQMQLQNLQLIAQGQEKLIEAQGGPNGPVLKLHHLANTLRKGVETLGFKSTGQFVADEKEIEQAEQDQAKQGPPPNPEMVKAQAHVQTMQQKSQADIQLAQQKHQADQQAGQQQAALDMQTQQQKLQSEQAIQHMRAEGELQIMREKMQGELALKTREMEMNFELEKQELAEELRLKELKIRMDGTKDGPGATELRQERVGDGS